MTKAAILITITLATALCGCYNASKNSGSPQTTPCAGVNTMDLTGPRWFTTDPDGFNMRFDTTGFVETDDNYEGTPGTWVLDRDSLIVSRRKNNLGTPEQSRYRIECLNDGHLWLQENQSLYKYYRK